MQDCSFFLSLTHTHTYTYMHCPQNRQHRTEHELSHLNDKMDILKLTRSPSTKSIVLYVPTTATYASISTHTVHALVKLYKTHCIH